jgi:enoyl-CoA hydratase/carnithine racemase
VNHTINGANLTPVHFGWEVSDSVATITLNRPERKNPLTLESYRELTDTFLALQHVNDVRAIVITGAVRISRAAAMCTTSSVASSR